VKVLLDVNTPRRVRGFLSSHSLFTAQEQCWQTLENGDLLRAAETAGFDVIATCDQNIGYQQNLNKRRIALVILSTNDWAVLKLAGDRIAEAVAEAKPNSYREVDVSAFGPRRMRGRRVDP
jgi:hypothetical protein